LSNVATSPWSSALVEPTRKKTDTNQQRIATVRFTQEQENTRLERLNANCRAANKSVAKLPPVLGYSDQAICQLSERICDEILADRTNIDLYTETIFKMEHELHQFYTLSDDIAGAQLLELIQPEFRMTRLNESSNTFKGPSPIDRVDWPAARRRRFRSWLARRDVASKHYVRGFSTVPIRFSNHLPNPHAVSAGMGPIRTNKRRSNLRA
jgi:hypothetical protein